MNQPRNKPVVIAGFGACMIGGKPFPPADSFFNQAVRHLEAEYPVESFVLSVPGFPVTRASKHIEKVLRRNPDYVVLQFSSVDASSPHGRLWAVRKRLGLLGKTPETSSAAEKSSASEKLLADFFKPLRPFDLLADARQLAKGVIAAALLLPPCTSRAAYRMTLSELIEKINAHGSRPVVLMPFPLLDPWANHISKQFADDLRKLRRKIPFLVLDTRKTFKPYPRHEIFLKNGMHLTRFAHSLIASHLSKIIADCEAGVCAAAAISRYPETGGDKRRVANLPVNLGPLAMG